MRQCWLFSSLFERGADGRELLLGLLGALPVPLGVRLDAQRAEQIGRGCTRVAGLTQDRVQALLGQVVKHQVDDAPRVIGLGIRGMTGLAVGVHAPSKTSGQPNRRSQLETVPRNNGFTL